MEKVLTILITSLIGFIMFLIMVGGVALWGYLLRSLN